MAYSKACAAIKLGGVVAAVAFAQAAAAQSEDVGSLPADMQSAPAPTEFSETQMSEDGVQTIIRTRRIERSTAEAATQYRTMDDAYRSVPVTYAPAPAVFERDQWIAECERRTAGYDGEEKGGIIGTLLGALTGGLIGNRVAGAGERLGGTLIGAGVGGLGGLLLGNLIGRDKEEDGYDCEAALDSYLSQHGREPVRIAQRSIEAPAPYAPAYAPYGYGAPYPYAYAPPQQVVYVPVRYEQQQRVIVRETVREEGQ